MKKLNIFFTAGFLHNINTLHLVQTLEKAGADMVEIGIPYSDPVVDGPVIQQANAMALAHGMTLPKLLHELKDLRKTVKIPVILMGYFNPVLQFGVENFCQKSEEVGVSGVILPDLPPKVFERAYADLFQKHNLDFTFIVTPQTSVERMVYLDNLSNGFVYAVSDNSITGGALQLDNRKAYFEKLQNFDFKNDCMVGFGIRNAADFQFVTQYVDGGIIGTAFIRHLMENAENPLEAAKAFVHSIKG